MVCDCGIETKYLMALSTDWYHSAYSVPYSSKISDIVASGCGATGWRWPVDSDGGGRGVDSRETRGG